MLYNIHTRTVEDFTERGLDDLKHGLVRTPLEPFETFWQDPLRVMRCIRFAARFNFKIVDEAKTAILDPRIKQALKTKISKERIGAELDKMIDDGAGRSTAIQLLHDLSLYDVVFAPPEVDGTAKGTTIVQGDAKDVEDAFKLVWIMEWLLKINVRTVDNADLEGRIFQAEVDLGQESLLSQTRGSPLTTHLYPVVTSTPSPHVAQIISKEEPFPEKLGTRNLILAGMLYPYRDMTAVVNKKHMSAGSWILRYGLKGKNLDIDIVTKLMESIEPVQRVVRTVTQNPAADEEGVQRERAEMGTIIRDIGFVQVIGKKWPCAFLLALGVDLIPRFDTLRTGVQGDDLGHIEPTRFGFVLMLCVSMASNALFLPLVHIDEETKAMIAAYNGFLSKAAAYQIDHCFAWKYLVDVGVYGLCHIITLVVDYSPVSHCSPVAFDPSCILGQGADQDVKHQTRTQGDRLPPCRHELAAEASSVVKGGVPSMDNGPSRSFRMKPLPTSILPSYFFWRCLRLFVTTNKQNGG